MRGEIFELLKEASSIMVIDEPLPNNYPCITFHFYNEQGELFGAGTATEESASCQIDIWYRTKTDEVKATIKNIKQAIKNERYFTYPSMESNFEQEKKIYHTHINFKLIYESED